MHIVEIRHGTKGERVTPLTPLEEIDVLPQVQFGKAGSVCLLVLMEVVDNFISYLLVLENYNTQSYVLGG